MSKNGEFNWNELQTCDAEKAVDFYGRSIGWQFQAEEMPSGGTYWIGIAAGKPVCGILTVKEGELTQGLDRWVTYIHVDDVSNALSHVKKYGGSVLRAPWDVPGVGRIAMIRDPGGADFGLVKPESIITNM